MNQQPVRKEHGKPLDKAIIYQNSPQVVSSMDIEGEINFQSLGDLKSMFKSKTIILVPIEGLEDPVPFRVKQCDPGTLMLTNRTLMFLLSQGISREEIAQANDPFDLMTHLDPQTIPLMEQSMAQDLLNKQKNVMANIIEPEVDLELVQSFTPDILELFWATISSGMEAGQQWLQQFLEVESDQRG